MNEQMVLEIQRLYPQIYLACHVDHVRATSTSWRLSSHDSAVLSHLQIDFGISPRELASHLDVVPSTLSATVKRLEQLGYVSSSQRKEDKRRREIFLTTKGLEAMAATSVLDGERVCQLLETLSEEERKRAVDGLQLLGRAARAINGGN